MPFSLWLATVTAKTAFVCDLALYHMTVLTKCLFWLVGSTVQSCLEQELWSQITWCALHSICYLSKCLPDVYIFEGGCGGKRRRRRRRGSLWTRMLAIWDAQAEKMPLACESSPMVWEGQAWEYSWTLAVGVFFHWLSALPVHRGNQMALPQTPSCLNPPSLPEAHR